MFVCVCEVNLFSLEHSKHLKPDVARVSQECLKGVSRVFQGVSNVLQGYSKGVPTVFKGCPKGVSKLF